VPWTKFVERNRRSTPDAKWSIAAGGNTAPPLT
jgi:hypothetical protein